MAARTARLIAEPGHFMSAGRIRHLLGDTVHPGINRALLPCDLCGRRFPDHSRTHPAP
jgi:hypothetical protein